MRSFKIGSITITLKYFTLNNGLPYYQRTIPADLQSRLGKKLIRIPLSNDSSHANQLQHLAARHTALFKAMRNDPGLVDADKRLAAIALLDNYGLRMGDGNVMLGADVNEGYLINPQPHLDDFLDSLEHDKKLKPVERLALHALKNPLPMLLSQALDVYFSNHAKGKNEQFKKETKAHWDKLVEIVGDKGVPNLSRDDAKLYRDKRLTQGVRTTTVDREIATLRAVYEKVIAEENLNIQNPFTKLVIHDLGKDAVKRQPFTNDELKALVKACMEMPDERRVIILLLACTGARLGEIVGLRRQDVVTDGLAHIKLVEYEGRTLKNKNSVRDVPIVDFLLPTIKEYLASNKSKYLFPSYCSETGVKADSASGALNPWIKRRVNVSDRTCHGLRHKMRDLLRNANPSVPESLARSIGGWDTTDVADEYGKGYELKLKLQALERALKPILSMRFH